MQRQNSLVYLGFIPPDNAFERIETSAGLGGVLIKRVTFSLFALRVSEKPFLLLIVPFLRCSRFPVDQEISGSFLPSG